MMPNSILQWIILALSVQIASPQAPPAASVRGIVRRADTNGPLAGATVEMRRVDGTPPQTYSAVTDGNGTFAVLNLRPGDYLLSASRNGFLSFTYGQRRLGGDGVPLTLSAGQTKEDVETILTPAGVISGRLRDREGDPVGAAAVQALVPVYQDGRRALKPVQTAYTNDLGEYRLFGLLPGRYFLSAMSGGQSQGALRISPNPAGLSDDGRIFVDTSSRPMLPSGMTYVPIYYPGTADVRAATTIDLAAGANLGGVDFTAAPIQTRHIRGIVPGGGASVSLVPLDPAASIIVRANQTSANDGPFDIRGVAPGTYLLIAHSGDLSASLRVDVRDADIDNITLSLGSPIVIPTHVSFDDRMVPGIVLDFESVRLRLTPDPVVSGISGDVYSPFPDGSMGFEVLQGESYRIKLESAFDSEGRLRNAYLKSIRMGTRDVLNDGLQFNGEPDAKIEVVIGMNPGSLSGTVVTTVKDKQQPVVNTTVVLVPDAARRRRPEAYKTATSDGAGQFQMSSIAPGDYLVFAWDDVENGVWQDPDFLRLYENQGTRVHISDDGRENVTVSLLPLPKGEDGPKDQVRGK